MTLRSSYLSAAMICAAAMMPAFHSGAADAASIQGLAEVVSSEPIYQIKSRKVPVQTCTQTQQRARPSYLLTNGVAGAVAGAVIGGVAGHQFGSGRGNDIATAAGAIVGAGVGQRVAHQKFPDGELQTIERCQTEYESQREPVVTGYRVRYRYLGEEFETKTKAEPGAQIPVRISVTAIR